MKNYAKPNVKFFFVDEADVLTNKSQINGFNEEWLTSGEGGL